MFRVCIETPACRHDCLYGWPQFPVSSSSRGWLIPHTPNSCSKLHCYYLVWPVPTINHIDGLCGVIQGTPKNIPIRYDIQELRYYLPEAKGKGQISFWEEQIFHLSDLMPSQYYFSLKTCSVFQSHETKWLLDIPFQSWLSCSWILFP